MASLYRRDFLASSLAAGISLSTSSILRANDANRTVVLALMGANDRGSQLAKSFAKRSDVRIAYVCDPDERAIGKGIDVVTSQGGPKPEGIKDFRHALEDPHVDGLICAAPNHWHAAATLATCAAGKNIYVEKPASHTAEEGEMMIAAAKKSGKAVQVGMQRRSGPLYHEIIDLVHSGALGTARYAKAWYYRVRPSIGTGQEVSPPSWLDYSLWQGPAPERPYRDNILHYNWHFFWHWGNAELGNNGVHTLDICRWALGVGLPDRVSVSGIRSRYDDDQQTPDTTTAIYDCDGKTIVWEAVSWSAPYGNSGAVGMEIRGDEGTMFIDDLGYTIYDLKGKVVKQNKGSRGDDEHIANFLDAVREGKATNANIEEGHISAMYCHLGNMAYRTNQILEIDSDTGRTKNNQEASQYWGREYRPGWSPQELG
jgi:predicted dehydrogenase